jgi:hypothetical protein
MFRSQNPILQEVYLLIYNKQHGSSVSSRAVKDSLNVKSILLDFLLIVPGAYSKPLPTSITP